MNRPIEVCIILEGSYPYITGGVSSWIHDLIINIPQVNFKLFTISPEKNQPLRYQLPENVIEHMDVVLTEDPHQPKKRLKKKSFIKGLIGFHKQMFSGGLLDVSPILEALPEGHHLGMDAVKNKDFWNLITRSNSVRNPLYPFSDYFWAWRAAHFMLFKTLSTELPQADIYHALSTGFAGMAALKAKKKTGKPLILTEHGLYHKEREMEIRKAPFVKGYQRDMWTRMYNRFAQFCYKESDLVTALFEHNRRLQIEFGAKESNTVVIPNGIDIERFATIKKEKKEGYHIGLVGRMVPIKDIKTFIAMCKILSKEIPEARFYAIGPTDEDPEYFQECQAMVKSLYLEDCFEFTGRADVREYYSFLDVLLLTSVREAQPLVILEAYAAEVPVVSTKVGNVDEMLDYDERILSPPKDSSKLAEGVLFLYKNPDITQQMNNKNKQKVYDFYDKKDLHRKYRELYTEMRKPWQE